MGKQPDTELTVLPSRSTTGSTGDDPENTDPRRRDLIYVEGVKNDSGPVGPETLEEAQSRTEPGRCRNAAFRLRR
jgi:hypothetical protein